jgi:hypothetical protein
MIEKCISSYEIVEEEKNMEIRHIRNEKVYSAEEFKNFKGGVNSATGKKDELLAKAQDEVERIDRITDNYLKSTDGNGGLKKFISYPEVDESSIHLKSHEDSTGEKVVDNFKMQYVSRSKCYHTKANSGFSSDSFGEKYTSGYVSKSIGFSQETINDTRLIVEYNKNTGTYAVIEDREKNF